MKIVQPMGNANLAPLLCRIPLGFYLFIVGLWGIMDHLVFSVAIEQYTRDSNWFFAVYAPVAPYLALVSGILIILGLFTTAASLLATVLIIPLLAAAGAFSQGISSLDPYIQHRSLIRDSVLLGVSLSLLFSGPGLFSLDAILQKVYKNDK